MRTWVKCKYIKQITPQMKFLFELYKNQKDNKDLIKALTKQINYCDNKTYNSLSSNKHRMFYGGKYCVEISNDLYNYTLLDNSKTKGILTNLRIISIYSEYVIYNFVRDKYVSHDWDKSFILKSASVLSEGTYRLYKNEIYKLCNKT